jgi:hypothetical protein
MFKLNKLFYLSNDQEVFGDRIIPTTQQRDFLVGCKNSIRDHLRPRIALSTKTSLGMPRSVEPKFRTQGSWSYKTCVQPPFTPPQEMDWDFGVYLPVQVWEENGPPHAMAKVYFELVESLLQDLCEQKGWTLISGKDTCIRVQVAVWAHIDIPLYAAPEKEFQQILEKAALASQRTSVHDSVAFAESVEYGELAQQVWEDLDQIMMATRTGEWRSSDPEAVARWFNDQVARHGEQLRRVCCYAKAWRDQTWQHGGGPSSVAIMLAVSQTFAAKRGRDDLALEEAMRHLGAAMLGELRESAIDNGAENFNRLSKEDREIASASATSCAKGLVRGRTRPEYLKDLVIRDVQEHFGDRIPNDVSLIDIDAGVEEIRSVPATRVVPPVVRATSAG